MTKLIVVRHGETSYNKARRYQGSTDVPLNDAGQAQAETLARSLRHIDIDVIVASPLRRAHQTAEPLARSRGCEIVTMDAFAERCLGDFEGLTREAIAERFPEAWARDINHQMYAAPPGGESLLELSVRVDRGLSEIRSRWPLQNVVLVSHAAVARALNGMLLRLVDEEMFGFLLRNGEHATYELS